MHCTDLLLLASPITFSDAPPSTVSLTKEDVFGLTCLRVGLRTRSDKWRTGAGHIEAKDTGEPGSNVASPSNCALMDQFTLAHSMAPGVVHIRIVSRMQVRVAEAIPVPTPLTRTHDVCIFVWLMIQQTIPPCQPSKGSEIYNLQNTPHEECIAPTE